MTLHDDQVEQVDVIFAPVAGFYLLDLLAGRKKVLIVDTIRTGKVVPGTLQSFPSNAFIPGGYRLTISHQVSLPTALELGRRIGMDMPEVIDLIAVEAEDLETIREELTPSVHAAVDKAIELIKEWISRNAMEEVK